MNKRVLRFKDLKERVPYSRMHIFRLEKLGKFPLHIQLGPNSVGWLESEVDAWITDRADARPTQIETLTEPDPSVIIQQVAALKAVWDTVTPEARRQFLETATIEFIPENSGGAGVRLQKQKVPASE